MLSLLPEHVLSNLMSEWVEPAELRTLSSVIATDVFHRIVTQPGFIVRANKVVPDTCVAWMTETGIRVQLLDTEKRKNNDGTKMWLRNGKLHRDGDLPALIYANGYQGWYQNGQLHRDGDLPAAIWEDGRQDWYQNGKLHRDVGPAVVRADGTQEWLTHGRLVEHGI